MECAMNIKDYKTDGGKNLIIEYLDKLPVGEKAVGYSIRHRIEEDGIVALKSLKTRQLRGKLWEIKFSDNRIMYVVQDKDAIYFLHACKKQKGKAEKSDIDKAISRAKRFGLNVD
jgi:phage-related protein